MAENDCVEGDEELYRNVRYGWNPPHYTFKDGKLVIEPHAFWDDSPSKTPSVDRAKLLDFNPHRALIKQKPPRKRNSIVSIRAGDVCAIPDVKTIINGSTISHTVEVIPDPSRRSQAHSLITVDPDYPKDKSEREKTFVKLRRALARLANEYIDEHGWTLPLPK